MKKQNGFTLIELIVVISILGILAAFAIPKFVSIETNARKSVLKGVSGSVRSAAALAHSLTIAEGNGISSNTSVQIEGVNVQMRNGYPRASNNGIRRALNLSPDITGNGGNFIVQGNNCRVTYVNAAGAGAPPAITVIDSGC
ncbi:MAG: prepilin-type N-terminal cleavage/methylation domain-containing protein [Robiginitomaculum sp.]|nr:prepilin-type N-terminal cleavage/methylation domain-containing protein [Robiginitomaculum sp.]